MNRVVFAVVVVVFLFIAQNLIRNTYSLWQRQNIVSDAKAELERMTVENKTLKARLDVVKEPGFSEREARDKLLFVEPEEQIVLLPKAQAKSKNINNEEDPAWKQWVNLFF